MTLNDEETVTFKTLFDNVLCNAANLKIEDPMLPHKRNFSMMRKGSHPETSLLFTSPKNFYRKIFFGTLELAKMVCRERFELNNADFKYDSREIYPYEIW